MRANFSYKSTYTNLFYKVLKSLIVTQDSLRLNHLHAMMVVAARFEWQPNDPEIVSDVLFAIANVLSIARTTYLMPAFEVLGPLQISLGRMIGDITRFLVLFTLVCWTFCYCWLGTLVVAASDL